MSADDSQPRISHLSPGGVWVLTDGKIGDDIQCLAIATALDPKFEKRVVAPRGPWALLAPWGPVDPREAPGRAGGPLSGELPSVVIASGRRAIPHARVLKKASDGKVKIIILKDPRFARDFADMIWAPAHDQLSGANVFSTLTSPHGLAVKLTDAAANPKPAISSLPKPMLGVVLGGQSNGARYSADDAQALAAQLNYAARDYASLAITPSRRTPAEFLTALKAGLRHEHLFIWNGAEENPYVDILANAAALVVAADSHNMMSEALCTNVGVYDWRPLGLDGKLCWFADEMEASVQMKRFEMQAPTFARTPLDATPQIVTEIRKRLNLSD